MESNRVVTWSKENGIATIIIDNPPMNVLGSAVVEQLTVAVVLEKRPLLQEGTLSHFRNGLGKGVNMQRKNHCGFRIH